MKYYKKAIIYTIIAGILYSYTSSIYLGNYYRLTSLVSAEAAELIMMRMGYFLQAIGMCLYYFLYKKYKKLTRGSLGSTIIVGLTIIPMCIVQNALNIPLLYVTSFIFNLLVGMTIEMYLVELAHNVPYNHLSLCYGIAYAFGSMFTFFMTYFDGGKFMESPSMTFIYLVMATLAGALLVKKEEYKNEEPKPININSKKLIIVMSIFIIGGSIVTGLGDGIYNFGRWSSDADIRIVRAFYAIGLILAGYLCDKSRRIFSAITVTCLSYYIISAFLLNNPISPSMMMSLGYFCMSFISVYRYIMVVDLVNEHPQFKGFEGYGLMISRIAEGLTSLFVMIFPLSLTHHVIVTFIFYAPLIILTIYIDNIKYSNQNVSEDIRFLKICERYQLTNRESEICKMLIENASDDEIASKLFVSKSTIRFHISNIFKKTSCSNRSKIKYLFK